MLNFQDQLFGPLTGSGVGPGQTQKSAGFVYGTVGLGLQIIFGNAIFAQETGIAVIAGTGIQSGLLRHSYLPFSS
jgi:hypothetical protein